MTGWTRRTGYGVPLLSVLVLVGTLVRPTSVDAANWSIDSNGTTQDLSGVACASATFCKAVGDGGTIVSWNGSSWSADTGVLSTFLNGVTCATTSFCEAVGDSGTILSWDGSGWSSDISGIAQDFYGVSCVGGTFCKVVGQGGAILSLTTSVGEPAPCSPGSPTFPGCRRRHHRHRHTGDAALHDDQ
jgi:hypothetical protein